jgi:hypothetical protein
LFAEASLELGDIVQLGVAGPHSVKPPGGQRGVEVVEERVVSEGIHRGRVTRQGLDGFEVE